MASLLKVDTITGVTTAGSISVTGEGNSTTTNLQQGLAKAWVNFTGVSSTAARDSFNVSSLTDDGTGRTTVAFSNNMANANYSGSWYNNGSSGGNYNNFSNDYAGGFMPRVTGSYSVYAYGTAAADSFHNDSTIVGDLA